MLGQPVTARNADDTDVDRWLWKLVDQPIGSTATLSAVDAPQVTFTPDVEGSYLLELAVNDGAFGELYRIVAAVEDADGYRYPATGETALATNFAGVDPDKGWGKDAEALLRREAGGGGSPVDLNFEGAHSYASTGVLEVVGNLGEVPEDTVWGIEAKITAASGGGGLIFSSIVQLRGTARRAAGGALAVDSSVLTAGNLPGDSANLLANGNTVDLRFITTRVDDVEVVWSATATPVTTATA